METREERENEEPFRIFDTDEQEMTLERKYSIFFTGISLDVIAFMDKYNLWGKPRYRVVYALSEYGNEFAKEYYAQETECPFESFKVE